MAYFHFFREIDNDCLVSNFQSLLEEIGLSISEESSTHAQIFAEEKVGTGKYNSKVKVLISWEDKARKQCSIEVRSDEPHLQKDTSCERIASKLKLSTLKS